MLTFAAIGLAFYGGYLARNLWEAPSGDRRPASTALTGEIENLRVLTTSLGDSLAALRQATDALYAARTETPACCRAATGKDDVPAAGAHNPEAGPNRSPAVRTPADSDEAARIRQDALDAFISGTHLKEIMSTEAFGRLAVHDRELVISDMVQLVNDGLVSDDLIYGP
jgi:hypothetical protein